MVMTRPRCPTCHQPLPLQPAMCTCGHPDSSHHAIPAGRLTYCCAGSQAGNCPCRWYRQVTAARFGAPVWTEADFDRFANSDLSEDEARAFVEAATGADEEVPP